MNEVVRGVVEAAGELAQGRGGEQLATPRSGGRHKSDDNVKRGCRRMNAETKWYIVWLGGTGGWNLSCLQPPNPSINSFVGLSLIGICSRRGGRGSGSTDT